MLSAFLELSSLLTRKQNLSSKHEPTNERVRCGHIATLLAASQRSATALSSGGRRLKPPRPRRPLSQEAVPLDKVAVTHFPDEPRELIRIHRF